MRQKVNSFWMFSDSTAIKHRALDGFLGMVANKWHALQVFEVMSRLPGGMHYKF